MEINNMSAPYKRIYLGTWFQRTSLHLKEFYDFIEGESSFESLNTKKLEELLKNLKISKTDFYRKQGFEIVTTQSENIDISMTEDGILLIHSEFENIESAMKNLEKFYSQKLGPSLNYLYSLGAPLPKDLTKIKEIYPLYMVSHHLTEEEINNTFKMAGDKPFLSYIKKENIEIITGNELQIINFIGETIDHELVEELVRNMVLFREFEKQLRQYLNLHRTLWEKITAIRESKDVTLEQFPKIRSKIEDYLKTLSFVKARISQMEDILIAREATLHETMSIKKVLNDLDLMSRFQMFKANQAYLLHLWDVTIEYAEGTISMLDSMVNENTQKEIGVLQVITFIGVLTGFFGMNIAFPWDSLWAKAFHSSFIVVGLIIIVSFFTKYILKKSVYKTKIKMK